MLDAAYLARLIITVLEGTPFPDVDRAVPILLGTAAQESGLRAFRQRGNGPARGLWQMEPETAKDHWTWLNRHQAIATSLTQRCGIAAMSLIHLECNIPYQILMARVHYYRRDPQRLPDALDVTEQARRWKRFYNTPAGRGTEAQYVANYQRLIAPLWTPGGLA